LIARASITSEKNPLRCACNSRSTAAATAGAIGRPTIRSCVLNMRFFGPGNGSPMATNVVLIVLVGVVVVIRFSIP